MLLLVTLDSLAWGEWIVLWPQDLLSPPLMRQRNDTWAWQLLQPTHPKGDPPGPFIEPPRDAGLWHLLGFIYTAHAVFLGLAAWKPSACGGLVFVPLFGRALGAGLWLWALATTSTFPRYRVPFDDRDLLVQLAAHEVVCVLALAAFLVVWCLAGRDGRKIAAAVQ